MTPANLKYTDSHEWVKTEADGTCSVGITFHAQDMLGDVVFVENPVTQGQADPATRAPDPLGGERLGAGAARPPRNA